MHMNVKYQGAGVEVLGVRLSPVMPHLLRAPVGMQAAPILIPLPANVKKSSRR